MYHVIWHYLQLFDYVICYIRHLHCVIWHNIHFCFTIMFISGRPFDCLIQVNFHKINHIFLQLPKYFDISDSLIETLIMLMIRASRTHYFPTSRNQWIFTSMDYYWQRYVEQIKNVSSEVIRRKASYNNVYLHKDWQQNTKKWFSMQNMEETYLAEIEGKQ